MSEPLSSERFAESGTRARTSFRAGVSISWSARYDGPTVYIVSIDEPIQDIAEVATLEEAKRIRDDVQYRLDELAGFSKCAHCDVEGRDEFGHRGPIDGERLKRREVYGQLCSECILSLEEGGLL